MTRSRKLTRSSRLIVTALMAGTALSTAAWAQFGGGPMVPPAGPAGMPPMPMNGGPNPPGGSPFGGRMPFANGTVTAVDSAAGTVTLAPMFGGGQPQRVRVTDATQITATRAGTVGDLKVGDTIQVRGVPTGITASQIVQDDGTAQTMPAMGGPMAGPRFGAKFGGRPGPLGIQAASAQATGKITVLTPLTVSVSDSVQVTLNMAPDAKITRNVTEKIGGLKVGDRLMANGIAGDDGMLAATRIRINADFGMGSMMPAPR